MIQSNVAVARPSAARSDRPLKLRVPARSATDAGCDAYSWCHLMRWLAWPDHQNAVRIDFDNLARKDHVCRTEFLDHRRPIDLFPRRQQRPIIDRGVLEARAKIHRAAGFR